MLRSTIFLTAFGFCRSHWDGGFPGYFYYFLCALLRIASRAIRSPALYSGYVRIADVPYSVSVLYGAGLRIKAILRSSQTFSNPESVARRCSVKKLFLEISQKFTGKHLRQSLFLIYCRR